MARKKDEDDWFEEDEAEEENKPKKKRGKKGKKAWKIAIWIAAFVVILAILLFIRFRYTAAPVEPAVAVEEAPAEEVEERYVPEPEEKESALEEASEGSTYEEPRHLGPDVVSREDLPNVQEVIDTSEPPQLFSNLRCDYDAEADILYISLRVYNILEEDVKISPRGVQKGYNTYFLIRGVVDTDPGCGTELLQPGEYTDCKRIGFDLPRYSNQPGINRISVQVPSKTEALLFECPEVPEESAINQWINKIQV